MRIQRMVVGFAYHDDKVLLMKKNNPPWQSGKFNGIGGKVKENETPSEAMVREFGEETGYETTCGQWQQFDALSGFGYQVSAFATRFGKNEAEEVYSTTNEPILWVSVNYDYFKKQGVYDLPQLVERGLKVMPNNPLKSRLDPIWRTW